MLNDKNALRNHVQRELNEAVEVATTVADSAAPGLAKGATVWVRTLEGGHKILFCGNGGSAADCQHAATELVVRLKRNRKALAALALTTDTSALTAAANDFGFEKIFSRQVEALGNRGDLLVAISTSGGSPNIIQAAKTAAKLGLKVMGLTGPAPNPLARRADYVLSVPALDTQRIQEVHITYLHILCRQAERLLLKR
jgi:D-sedoheptulose 7-phosphate isomerase